ncbi:hypothetical protein SK128_027818, partial [Halocaridina rubra]
MRGRAFCERYPRTTARRRRIERERIRTRGEHFAKDRQKLPSVGEMRGDTVQRKRGVGRSRRNKSHNLGFTTVFLTAHELYLISARSTFNVAGTQHNCLSQEFFDHTERFNYLLPRRTANNSTTSAVDQLSKDPFWKRLTR